MSGRLFGRARFLSVLVAAAALLAAFALPAWAQEKPKLVVYTYDSFAAWGPGAFIEEQFEARYNADLVLVAPASSNE
ncbi:MAG TPA: hypothetical protein VIL08_06015, partial [Limnochorda sp.]